MIAKIWNRLFGRKEFRASDYDPHRLTKRALHDEIATRKRNKKRWTHLRDELDRLNGLS